MNKIGLGEHIKRIQSKKAPNAVKKELADAIAREPLLIKVLEFTYHPGVQTSLPEGMPPFKKAAKHEDLQGRLYSEWRTMRIYCKGAGYDHLHPNKRESLFISLLESIDPDDADLLEMVKNKKIPYITHEMVSELLDSVPAPVAEGEPA